jgi:phage gp36-like protein
MPNWTSITVDDLKDAKVSALIEALRTKGLGVGQDDPVEEITANVIARIRAEIKGCAQNVLDTDATKIPNDLKSLACRMIYREMASRLQVELTPDERDERSDDVRYLERIAECEVPVAAPDNPETTPSIQSGSAAEIVTDRPGRKFTSDTLDGL